MTASFSGRCYCGEVRYQAVGEPLLKAQCHCRECQFLTGGSPNVVMGVPESGFSYTAGSPQQFRRPDLLTPVTREFCGRCGTQLVARAPALPGTVLIKVGTLDEPEEFGRPAIAIHALDKRSFHHIGDEVTAFDRLSG